MVFVCNSSGVVTQLITYSHFIVRIDSSRINCDVNQTNMLSTRRIDASTIVEDEMQTNFTDASHASC